MLNLAAIRAELPEHVVQWLDGYGASDDVWRALARDRAVVVGRRLLVNDGEAGWNTAVLEILLTDSSPAVRLLAAELPVGRRCWTAADASRLVTSHFGLAGADALRRVLRVEVVCPPNGHAPPADP
jgi:hypothetical protein